MPSRVLVVAVGLCFLCRGNDAVPERSILGADPASYFQPCSGDGSDCPVRVSGVLRQVWSDQKHIWESPFRIKKHDLEWLVPLGAATGFLIATDHRNISSIHGDPSNQKLSSNISNAGLAAFAGAGALSYGLGAITQDEHARETGILTAEALTDSFLASEALKLVSQRSRPAQDGSQGRLWQSASLSSSFPSQHAAMAWASAAVLAREYPGSATQWMAYGLASLVSLSRLTANQHFPSDILIGSATGYLIGRYVYRAHHDDRISDRTGAMPTKRVPLFGSGLMENAAPKKPATAPVYVPLDSWIYPALRRLADLGLIPDQVSGQAPWTRVECLRQTEEAGDLAGRHAKDEALRPIANEALRIVSDLRASLAPESDSGNVIRLESLYTRFTEIAGIPLRDGYHFGTTVANDYGRPFGQGLTNVTGFSSYAVSGRFSAYFRGEYEGAPTPASIPLSVREFTSQTDGVPLVSGANPGAANRFQPLEMYLGTQLGFESITFGKQSLWWGPDRESAFTFTNNAAPFYMLRFAQDRPLVLPGPFRLLGKIRTDIMFGKLSGNQSPARPFINAQKISLGLTDNFEVGFTKGAIFGGAGRPLTLGRLEASLFSVNSADTGAYGAQDLPGTRFSAFDFRWRVAGLRKYLTVYSDSYGRDEPSPIDNPKRAPWAPGVYVSHLPRLPRVDFRFETYATWLYRKDESGNFIYWDFQYRDAGTNDGNLFGSWVGRDSRAYTAEANYWFSARSKITGNFRQIKAGEKFLPGGGTQSDFLINAQWSFGPEWLLSAQVQEERYYIPILGPQRYNTLAGVGVTFTPRLLAISR